MEPFRRPLGVLILAVLVFFLSLAIGWSGSVTAAEITAVVALVAFFTAIGAVILIAWRLIRGPRRSSGSAPPSN